MTDSVSPVETKKYLPERDYKERNYKPFKAGFEDLCKNCKYYYKELHEKQLTLTDFPIQCQGHILDSVNLITKEDFDDPTEYEDLLILSDPVSWAYSKFGWEPRWYQLELLSCTSTRKIVRAGRRVGKCLAKGTLVGTPLGPIPIESLKAGDTVYDEFGKEIKVKEVFDQGIQEVIDLCNNGKILATCTENHPWLTSYLQRDEKPIVRKAKDIYKGIAIKTTEVLAPLGSETNNTSYVLGVLLGDGCCRESSLVISGKDEEVIKKVGSILDAPYKKYTTNNFSWHFSAKNKSKIAYYYQWLHKRYAHEKVVDLDVIKSWDRQSLLQFVAGLLDSDGSVVFYNNEIQISFGMQAKSVVEAICYAFLSLWQVQLSVHIENREKYVNGPIYYTSLKHIYHCKRILKELDQYVQVDRKKYKKEYDNLTPNNFNPSGVGISKRNRRLEHCYDIHVDSRTNLYLLANGLVTHNTQSIAVSMLWMTDVNEYFTILVVAPYQAQVTILFDALNKFIDTSIDLQSKVSRNTKNPHRIEFMNGSKILGFSSGSKSAARSDKIRGQDANYIVLDEADYLADEDLESILAILASHPECGLWASSTPTGLHGKFYQWCISKDLGFKEFHYISAESPSWTKTTEDFYRQDYEIDKYEHEFLAEFGLQTKGVFRNDLIDQSLESYSLPRIRTPGSRIVIGVDWNGSEYGVHICVVEWTGDKYILLDKLIIKSGEFTQHKAIEKIIQLNDLYNPGFIYVDKGYGEVQVEMLQKYGLQHRTSSLHKKVKPYSFGEQIEILEPTTGQKIKKASKPFMVNTCAIQLEEKRLILPTTEDTQMLFNTVDGSEAGKTQGLVQQMRNFQIVRYSVYGLPAYSQGEDHTLVAYMLAIVGFMLEYSDMRKLNLASSIYFLNQDHKPNISISDIPRQLDRIDNKQEKKRVGLLQSLMGNKKSDRNVFDSENKKSLKKHFNIKNINRNSNLNRRGFQSWPKRGLF